MSLYPAPGARFPLRGPIARGTIRTSFVLGLRLIVQAGTLLLVARLLGPDQFGGFAGVAALAVMLGTLATFGTHLVLLGEVSKEPARRTQVLPYAVPTTLLCGAALLAIYLVACLSVLHASGVSIAVLLTIGITETLLQPLFALPAAEQLALGRIARSQLLQTLPLALRLAAAAGVFALQLQDPLAVYGYGYLIASVIALGVATVTMPAPWPGVRTWRLPHRAELREAFSYAVINITAASPAELDKTLAAWLLPLPAAGLYSAAARVIGASSLPVSAMTASALPRLFRESARDSSPHLNRLMFGTAFAYGAILAAALWLIAPIFDWIFGNKYQGIDSMIRWLCIAIPGLCVRRVAGSILMASGHAWSRVGFEATGLAALVLASIGAVAAFGEIGMPIALATSEWLMALLGALLVALDAIQPRLLRSKSQRTGEHR